MLGIWERLNHLMEVNGESVYALEKALNLSTSQVYSWIKNDRYPRADIALKLANHFHVSLQWLLTGNDPNALPPEVIRMFKNKELIEAMKRVEMCNMRQMNAVNAMLDAFDF